MNAIYYIQGKYLPVQQASLPLNDLGILRGYGVFEFLRTYNGRPFRLKEHLQRLEKSARDIQIELPHSRAEFEGIILETLRRNDFPEAVVRLIVTGGPTEDTIYPSGKPTVIVMVSPLPSVPERFYTEGIKVITVSLERYMPGTKGLNYTSAVLAQRQARAAGAVEALYKDEQGNITEGSTTNFFAIRGEQVITPENQVLKGITRGVVLELARKKFEVVHRPIHYGELGQVDEAFLTGTTKEIAPIVLVDDIQIGNGQPGAKTLKLLDEFRRLSN